MKLIGKLIGTVFALVVAIFMVQGIASETGEVVVLTTVEQRDGVTNTYTVTSAPAQVGTVNELMRQKYGWRDQFISLMAPREASVVLRLTAVS